MSPGRTLLGSIAAGATIWPTPAVLMNMPSALPRSTTLVSPVTSRTPAVAAASTHRHRDPAQGRNRQPLLQYEADAEIERPRSTHGEVVDGAVDGESADVAAGEDEWLHHVGIGGEGDRSAKVEHGSVVTTLEHRLVKGGTDDGIEKPPHRAAAAAMGKLDDLSIRGWQWAGHREVVPAHHPPPPADAVRPAIAVIRRAGALPGNHRDAERPLRRAARAESGALRRVCVPRAIRGR